MSRFTCREKYEGPSYPEAHGTRCMRALGHDEGEPRRDQKHLGRAPNGLPIEWFTPGQKARRAEMKRGAAQ